MNSYKVIVNRCRKRDRRAQLEFYMMFYKSVYNSCLRILGNQQEAEEIMQESFLKVLNKPELIEEDTLSMEKILKRIAINSSIDLYRKRKIKFIELDDKYSATLESETEEYLQDEIRLEAIEKMMQLLPEGYRMILSLHLIEGMEYAEIAERLNLSASTIRSQFVRARQKLINLIKEHYNHENLLN
ncbi:RNA polymerase sigma factor [Odoribacter lunatus]|uniref:RNA polymerase sigma factor n=1 Tax=Odoribacter lunatus TaxID=2941335 RepID=UPI00203AAD71|nr:RNA polymerase sigma factor [Odoribacter lunatus]